MKKILLIAAMGILAFIPTEKGHAQTGLTPTYLVSNGGTEWNISSNSVDTLVKSTTVFWSIPATSTKMNQDFSFTVSVDSVAGTPDVTFQPYVSNDAVHWSKVGSAVVFGPNASTRWKLTSTVPGVSDTCTTVNTNPWIAKFFGMSVVTNGNTQRGVYHIKVVAKSTY